MRRDARLHASPNAGWPEAAMAGALDLRLAGPIAYDGVMHDKPWIGDGARAPSSDDIRRALRLYLRPCALLWPFAGGADWALCRSDERRVGNGGVRACRSWGAPEP